jgi:hypothetical protein
LFILDTGRERENSVSSSSGKFSGLSVLNSAKKLIPTLSDNTLNISALTGLATTTSANNNNDTNNNHANKSNNPINDPPPLPPASLSSSGNLSVVPNQSISAPSNTNNNTAEIQELKKTIKKKNKVSTKKNVHIEIILI